MRFIDYPAGKWKVVGYRAKWDESSFESLHTQRSFEFPKSERPLLQSLMDIARRCWHLFGLRGYARVDFRVDESNQPWCSRSMPIHAFHRTPVLWLQPLRQG